MDEEVYIVHFDEPLQHARHYVGYTTKSAEVRFEVHKSGQGSRLIRAVVRSGINIQLAAIFKGGRGLERQIKRGKNTARHCPICHAEHLRRDRERRRAKKDQVLRDMQDERSGVPR